MRVTASLLLPAVSKTRGLSWSDRLTGETLLARACETMAALSPLDEGAVLTDDPILLARGTCRGIPIRRVTLEPLHRRVDYLTCEGWRIEGGLEPAREANMLGEVHFFLDWRLPLLRVRTLEEMYHRLLEDRLAARVLPLCPVDPNLYFFIDGDRKRPFPVWSHQGQDRQAVPQLYRTFDVCVAHIPRLIQGVPHSIGHRIALDEAIEIQNPADLELAAHVLLLRAGGRIVLPAPSPSCQDHKAH